MRRSIPASLIALTLLASPLPAAQHLWDIQEVYSNPSGSVQFIEFFTVSASQQFVQGFTITATNGTPMPMSFTFPTNLLLNSPLAGHPNTASTTAGQTFLVATSNFESLYGIVPDFVIPAGFLTTGSGFVLSFNVSPPESVNLNSLPMDGVMSLNALSSDEDPTHFSFNAMATPKNFRGETVVIPEPGTTAMFLLGLGGLLGALRRRARGAQA